MILVVSSIVITIGIASVNLARQSVDSAVRSNDWLEAQVLAFSAVEHALTTLSSSTDSYLKLVTDSTEFTQSLGRGTFSWKLRATSDTGFIDMLTTPVKIRGTGQVGEAVYHLSIEIVGDGASGFTIKTDSWQRVVE